MTEANELASLRQEIDSLRHTLQQLLARDEQAKALVWPQHFEGEPGEQRMDRIEQQIATLGQRRKPYKPILLPKTTVRLGQIKEVFQVAGPPSAHLYSGVYTGGGAWDGLQELGYNSPNVVYLPMQVDDEILVVFTHAKGTKGPLGILGGESPDFVVCECDWGG